MLLETAEVHGKALLHLQRAIRLHRYVHVEAIDDPPFVGADGAGRVRENDQQKCKQQERARKRHEARQSLIPSGIA